MTTTTGYIATNLSNMSSFSGILQSANQSAGDYLFTAIDILVFLVLLITLAGSFPIEVAIMSAGFVGIILSLLFVYMGVMAWTTAGVFVGIIVASMLYVTWSNKSE